MPITLPPYEYDPRFIRKAIQLTPTHAFAATEQVDAGDPLDSAGMVLPPPETHTVAMAAKHSHKKEKKQENKNKIKYIIIGIVAVVWLIAMYKIVQGEGVKLP